MNIVNSQKDNLSEAELKKIQKKREKNRRRRAKKKLIQKAKSEGKNAGNNHINNNKNNGISSKSGKNDNIKSNIISKKRPSPRNSDTAKPSNKLQRTVNNSGKNKVNEKSRTSSTTRSAFTDKDFSTLNVVQEIKDAIAKVFQYELMTKCQEMSIPKTLNGDDALVKAKTGTGKTLGFLIPAVNRLHLNTTPNDRNGIVSILIISPTRELASQIEEEALQLTSFLRLNVQCCFGGTNIKKDLSKFRRLNFPDILVGTPGRVNDLLENHGLQSAMSGLNCLILDEADRLLDMGFRPDLTRMLNMLPTKNTRQTLLFSATMPKDIMKMSNFALRENFLHIDTVGKEDQDTHKRIPQFVTVYPFDEHFSQLINTVEEGMKVPGYKIIVFFVTARLTQLNAEVFNLMGYNVLEIHSRKSQSYRTKTSDKFRNQSSVIVSSHNISRCLGHLIAVSFL
jgi:ATP-dependent RNA helicase MSS116, mitochondrial